MIVFVTGGMWIIGYKAWGALLALSLMKQGFIVASLDYRNFPQGTVGDMVQDVGVGIGWVVKRAAALGGDPTNVVVVGQSAGAHLAATAILRQVEWELGGYGLSSPWSPASLAGFVVGTLRPAGHSRLTRDALDAFQAVFLSKLEISFN